MELDIGGLSKEAVFDEDKINNGVWVTLLATSVNDEGDYPALCLNGDPTKPQRAKVRSNRCQAIKDAEKARQKQGFVKMRLAKKKERDGVIVESSILPEEDRFSLILVALDNFSTKGGEQAVSQADAKALYGMAALDEIIEQIRQASYEDGLYMADAATSPGKGSPSIQTTVTPEGASQG